MAEGKGDPSKVGKPKSSICRDEVKPPRAGREPSDASREIAGSSRPSGFSRIKSNALVGRCWSIISWTPPGCRWDPENPPKFTMALNLLFGFASTFTVANLYYNQPILNILAEEFHITYEKVSTVPTVMQAGYAVGLLLICPLGDVVRRRAFILSLIWFTATVWLGLCLTHSFHAFVGLSFLAALCTVTPQLMLPLVGDLAPPARRATALSIVVSGLLLGMLVARFLSGVVAQFTSWRNIYWLSFALQYLILILLWLFLPDYPVTNPGGMNYFKMLWSIVVMMYENPVLTQACLIGFSTSSIFTSFWTTLTFLLSGAPYYYNPVKIGCFAFIGIGAMVLGPFFSRAVIDRFVPIFSCILGELFCLLGVVIGTYTGTFTVAGPIIQAFAIDIGLQTSNISNRAAIFSILPKARNRVNTAYMVSVFAGQLTGTSVGNKLYARAGWKASGSCSLAFACAALFFSSVRGPWTNRWLGWHGGWSIRRRDLGPPTERPESAVEQALDELSAEDRRDGVALEKCAVSREMDESSRRQRSTASLSDIQD